MSETNETIYLSTEKVTRKANADIPFERLEVGNSVFRSMDSFEVASIRSLVSHMNRKLEPKFFKVAIHNKERQIEIARVLNVNAVAVAPGIVTSSPEMLKIINNGLPTRTIYPFENLAGGQSFVVPIPTLPLDADQLEKSLRTACYVQGKKHGKKFVLMKHEDYGMFEVGCIPVTEPVFYSCSEALLVKANAPVTPTAVEPVFFTDFQERVNDYEN